MAFTFERSERVERITLDRPPMNALDLGRLGENVSFTNNHD